jgi:hypothetical protein
MDRRRVSCLLVVDFFGRSRAHLVLDPPPAAVLGITASVSDYLGPSGIRVCSVSPSIVATGMAGPHLVSPADVSALAKDRTGPDHLPSTSPISKANSK